MHEAVQGLCGPGGCTALLLMVQGRSCLVAMAFHSALIQTGKVGKALLLVHLWWGPGL